MTSSTATVETLTAEVRVLMVGSRQVTLSVYRQLDNVPLMAITPFGRVRLRETSIDWTIIRVVGADRDGQLVASYLSRVRMTGDYRDPGGTWANSEDGERTWGDLSDLPLIVLAGLR